ncbi:glucan endo-1,3-beta-glucosidase 5-like [Zingiber officinale]|uniref:glucan endo-1,3-beta-D-glucosidase n=1 Tax=Zingiber officinale TaxID=94328 RepID=A0A8J5KRH4_ZINOF|nr:glucan endo-1,3-beta-glucosidase 5-like [Zingiber officinale]KAG6489392.1 hypothetical protein ZIOFF_050661 [Zingiber officinale]
MGVVLPSAVWLFFLLGEAVLMADGMGCNWGTRSSHPLPADIVVRLLRDNNFDKVKLFEADAAALRALGRSGIEVMVGIPNELLAPLAGSVNAAEQWVMQNVSAYVSQYGVNITHVAVGNEPFLKTYNGMFENTTFAALQNIQAALIKAGLSRQVRVTVPLNADVYQSGASGLPSSGDFRNDIHGLMVAIVGFLQDNGGTFTVNIYPFLSLYLDPHFPLDYAFFSPSANPIVDGPISYSNAFEASYDTLIWALERNGFGSMPVIVGEIGWPTDGDIHANVDYARRFNQGLVDRIRQRRGTPKRPAPPDIYLFGLLDEDQKSIQPGNFEPHWGLFYYDGSLKYQFVMDDGRPLVPARGVRYLERQWCVLSSTASVTDPIIADAVGYACEYADCTSLGYGSSCNGLDARGNVSYAFNQLFQVANQQKGACNFSDLSVVTETDPSQGSCRFNIMIDEGKHDRAVNTSGTGGGGALLRRWAAASILLLWTMSYVL